MRFVSNLARFDLKDEKDTFGKVNVCKLAQK